jgi:hypothetical protein
MTYEEKLKDPRWRAKSLEIREAKGNMCAQCGSEDTVHVHHMVYTTTMPWDEPNEHLIPLCETCHVTEHNKQRYGDKIDLNHAAMLGGFTPLDMRRIQGDLSSGRISTTDGAGGAVHVGAIAKEVMATLEAQMEYHGKTK